MMKLSPIENTTIPGWLSMLWVIICYNCIYYMHTHFLKPSSHWFYFFFLLRMKTMSPDGPHPLHGDMQQLSHPSRPKRWKLERLNQSSRKMGLLGWKNCGKTGMRRTEILTPSGLSQQGTQALHLTPQQHGLLCRCSSYSFVRTLSEQLLRTQMPMLQRKGGLAASFHGLLSRWSKFTSSWQFFFTQAL